MFGGNFNYETRFFAGGYELSGIESVNLSYQAAQNISKFLGTSKGLNVTSGPISQKISINGNLIYDDPLLAYTGDSNMSGSIHYNGIDYGFQSGYLSDYSLNCAVGTVPKVSTNFEIMDEMKTGVSTSGEAVHPPIYIPSQGSISVTCDNSTTNRVIGFDYSIKASRKVFYTLGSTSCVGIISIPPLEYSASVQIDVDDAFLENSHNFLKERENKTISFSIRGRGGENLQSLTIPKASLVGEQLEASSDGSVKLTLNYIGHS
jgi:hypothetical protein